MSENIEIYKNIGEKIKEARKNCPRQEPESPHFWSGIRHVSQTDLSRVCNVTFQQIQKYEKGTNKVPIDKLLKISKYLKKNLDYFLPKEMLVNKKENIVIGQLENKKD